jgi:hypothetical protein
VSGEPRSERERHETVVHDYSADGLPTSGNGWRAIQAERARAKRLLGDRDDGPRVGESNVDYRRRTQPGRGD